MISDCEKPFLVATNEITVDRAEELELLLLWCASGRIEPKNADKSSELSVVVAVTSNDLKSSINCCFPSARESYYDFPVPLLLTPQ